MPFSVPYEYPIIPNLSLAVAFSVMVHCVKSTVIFILSDDEITISPIN